MRTRRYLALAAVVLFAVAGCGGGQAKPQAGATTRAPTAWELEKQGLWSPTPSPSPSQVEPSPTPEATVASTPTPAWAPCDTSLSSYEDGGYEDFAIDSCDAAYAASKDGSLLDAFIENKIFVDPKRLKDCPQFLPAWKKAQTGFDDGSYEVGADVKPGTYETTWRVHDCYWERGGRNGNIIANHFITAAKKVRVTIRSSDEMFTSQGCGNWVKI